MANDELRALLAESENYAQHRHGCTAIVNPETDDCKCGFRLYQRRVTAALAEKGGRCSTDPNAPHGFDRNASHSENRYVCECEHYEARK